jgi:predicted ATPase
MRFLIIDLAPLDQESVYSIVSTALRSSDEKTFKLSEIVHNKSNGNPMYVIQFLIGLLEDGILRYNLGLNVWLYDELSVRSRIVTDNVAELAVARLQRLDARLQQVLVTAACLGQTFDKPMLEFVLLEPRIRHLSSMGSVDDDCESSQSNGDWASHLSEALGLLVQETVIDYIKPLDAYCFMHDLIQEAAFDLIPLARRGELQREVGRRLLRREGLTTLDDKFYFRAIDLSNTGSESLSEEEMVELAYCNEEAGQKAMAKACFVAALKYFEEGLNLLGHAAWMKEPQLALELSTGAVEASFCCGDFHTMDTRIASIMDRDPPIETKIRVSIAMISRNGVQFRHELSLEIGRRLLKEMKITIMPKRPRLRHLVIEFLKTKRLLRARTLESLSELPMMESKQWLQAMSVADVLDPVANSNVFFFVVLKLRSLQWTLQHGVCSCSPSIFAAYALLMCASGDVARAKEMGTIDNRF